MARPIILDVAGPQVTADEAAFLREFDPWGFIVFAHHCREPQQVRRLCGDLRDCVGRNAPILVDQEGGRVARLKPPHFQSHYPPALFGMMWKASPEKAQQAAKINAQLLARSCRSVGLNVNCAPVLDIAHSGSDPISIGDRAFSGDPEVIQGLGAASIAGHMAEGVLPVIKHLPGLGRARVDSHFQLPRINQSAKILNETDFSVFKHFADAPLAMTCHAAYSAYDPKFPATLSPQTIQRAIRSDIGFRGLLFSDAILMGALPQHWQPGELCLAALTSGCDVAIIAHLELAAKRDLVKWIPENMTPDAAARAAVAELFLAQEVMEGRDSGELYEELDLLLTAILR